MKHLASVITLMCLLGNIFHLYGMSTKYLEYAVSSIVTVQFPETITPPSLSIGVPALEFLHWEKMSDEEKRQIVTCNNTFGTYNPLQSCGESGTYIFQGKDLEEGDLRNASLLRQLSREENLYVHFNLFGLSTERNIINLTMDISEFIVSFELLVHREDDVSCETIYFSQKALQKKKLSLLNIRESLHIDFPFLRILKRFHFEPNKENTTNSYFVIRSQKRGLLYKFRVDRRELRKSDIKLTQATINLCPHGFKCHFGLSTDLTLNLDEIGWQTVVISYDEYRSRLLPYPYKTNCRDYQREDLYSREFCYLSCVERMQQERLDNYLSNNELINERRKCYSNVVDIVRREGFQAGTEHLEKRCKTFNDDIITSPELDDIEKNCSKLCPQRSCYNVIIIPHYKVVRNTGYAVYISVMMPSNPFISTTATEQVTLIAFLTDIASSLGFWFGLSAIGTAGMIVQYVRFIVRYLSRKRGTRRTWTTSLIVQNFGVQRRLRELESRIENEQRQSAQQNLQLNQQIQKLKNDMTREMTQIMQKLQKTTEGS